MSATRFLYAESGADGMGQWHLAIAQLIALAAKLSLILVEPCVLDGRLAPCLNDTEHLHDDSRKKHSPISNRGEVRPLSTYFDTAALRRKFQPRGSIIMLPFAEFVSQYNGSMLLQASRLVCTCKGCSGQCRSDSIIPGMSTAARTPAYLMKRVEGMPVLYLERYRFEYIHHTMLPRGTLAEARHAIRFAPALEALGADLPRALGLPDQYLALQWRSEGSSHDFSQCANALIASKLAAEETLGLSRDGVALLISDIPWNWNASLWANAMNHMSSESRAHEAQQALRTLATANLRKLDALPDMANADPGCLAVLDLILARRAVHLVACTTGSVPMLGAPNGARSVSACDVCARSVSLYAGWLVWLRPRNSTSQWLPLLAPRRTVREAQTDAVHRRGVRLP